MKFDGRECLEWTLLQPGRLHWTPNMLKKALNGTNSGRPYAPWLRRSINSQRAQLAIPSGSYNSSDYWPALSQASWTSVPRWTNPAPFDPLTVSMSKTKSLLHLQEPRIHLLPSSRELRFLTNRLHLARKFVV